MKIIDNPTLGTKYFYITEYGQILDDTWCDYTPQRRRLEIGNFFLTFQGAFEFRDMIKRIASNRSIIVDVPPDMVFDSFEEDTVAGLSCISVYFRPIKYSDQQPPPRQHTVTVYETEVHGLPNTKLKHRFLDDKHKFYIYVDGINLTSTVSPADK